MSSESPNQPIGPGDSRDLESTGKNSEAPIESEITDEASTHQRISQPADDPEKLRANKLGRLHPLSLFFDIASHIRTFIIPAVIALFSAASGSDGGLILAGFIFVPTLVASVIRYFSLRYRIQETELVVTEGIFFRRIRTVPIERIQNIDLMQNVLHRLFKVAEVRIETASGTEPEAVLRVLSMMKVDELRSSIFQTRKTKIDDLREDSFDDFVTEPTEQTLLTIPTNLLIRAGLASNRGTLLLGVLIGVYFQFNDQFEQYFDVQEIVRWFNQQYDTYTILFLSIVAIVFLLVFFRLLGIAWYILRFSGYKLTRDEDDLRIQCGLLTRVSATVPRQRIQFISIHRNLIMRWMNLASIRIETAGGAGGGREDAAKSVSSKWFIPVLRDAEVPRLINELRPEIEWSEDAFDWQPTSALAPKRATRIAIVFSLVVAAVGFAVSRPWGWAAGFVAMPFLVWVAIRRAKSRRYARTDNILVYRSGVFTRKTSLTFFEKIQTVLIQESPFDRRWNMATLSIDTAAAGPAEHVMQIIFLDRDFARKQFDEIIQQSSAKLPVFH